MGRRNLYIWEGDDEAYVVDCPPHNAGLENIVKAFRHADHPGNMRADHRGVMTHPYIFAAREYVADETAAEDGRQLAQHGHFATIPPDFSIGLHHSIAVDASRSLDEDPVIVLRSLDFGTIVAPNLSAGEAAAIYDIMEGCPEEWDDTRRKMLVVMEARCHAA